jgi:hypothetical protein
MVSRAIIPTTIPAAYREIGPLCQRRIRLPIVSGIEAMYRVKLSIT